jgi:ribosomal protein S18 acetylase RimI-like enzyme
MGNKYKCNQFEEAVGTHQKYEEVSLWRADDDGNEDSLMLSCVPDAGNSNVVMRHAIASDSSFIGRLSRKVFTIYGPYEDILSGWFISEKGITTIMACQDNIQIGFAMLGELCSGYDLQNASELLGIAVEPEKQGKGVGRMLLRAIDAVSADLGVKWLLLHSAADNTPARRLYEKTGYRPLEIKRNFYPEGQDAVVMYKELRTA